MNKTGFFNLLIFVLFIFFNSPHVYADSKLNTYNGYWIYGFEKSLFESCDGKVYWMWTPIEFKGKYTMEGYRNQVTVKGTLLPPDPANNIYSSLPTLQVVEIAHTSEKC